MNGLTARLRPLFLARLRREKILAVVFLVAVAAVWANTFVGRAEAFAHRWGEVRDSAAEQQRWLDGRAAIEGRFEAAVNSLSGSSFPARNEVYAQVDALVRKHGFPPNIEFPPSQSRDRITFHTINVSIEKAEYGRLAAFQREIATALPTVHLKQIKIVADRRSPAQLSARFVLEAIEFNR